TTHINILLFKVPEVKEEVTAYFSFSAVGENVKEAERKLAVISLPRSACLAQRNKPKYKQGETAHLRFPCFDENMKQVVRNFSKVTLEDPTGAKIYQVLNPATEQGVLTTSIPTSPLSREGYYGLKFEDDKGKIEYSSIWIERYELPRINWEGSCPSTISVLDRTAEISGSA
ncbi:ovostatin-like, partial [Pyxicephalus adspersus]|uniref:ovostatin-like n=1 Tax=Pyxicephalus adspersus TaxID=30357 RepID=UPI003B59D920